MVKNYFFSHKFVEVFLFLLPWFDILVELFFKFRIHFICFLCFRSHSLIIIIWLSCILISVRLCFCWCFLTGANLFLCEMLTSVFDFVWFLFIFLKSTTIMLTYRFLFVSWYYIVVVF